MKVRLSGVSLRGPLRASHGGENSIRRPPESAGMPPTKEVTCTSEDCFLDMFENHYTYDVPDDHSVDNLQCPVCGGTDCLEVIEL